MSTLLQNIVNSGSPGDWIDPNTGEALDLSSLPMHPSELSVLFPGFRLPYGSLMQQGVPGAATDDDLALRTSDPGNWLRRWASAANQQLNPQVGPHLGPSGSLPRTPSDAAPHVVSGTGPAVPAQSTVPLGQLLRRPMPARTAAQAQLPAAAPTSIPAPAPAARPRAQSDGARLQLRSLLNRWRPGGFDF